MKRAQNKLNKLGYGPLVEDGKYGPKTEAALRAFQQDMSLSVDGKYGPNTKARLFPKPLTTTELIERYGEPGSANLIQMKLPFPMKIAWDLEKTLKSILVHKDIAPRMESALSEILDVYGIDQIEELGINLFGGCYNYRKMRGGSDWSRHAWGAAIDLDPSRNPLRATSKTAQFAKPEYQNMIKIFYKHNFLGLGPEKNYDWMHFETSI